MKKHLLLFCILIFTFFNNNSLLAQPFSSYDDAELKQVTIYNQGANIERKGTLKVKKGSNEFVIQNVSPNLLNESIQFVIFSDQVIINAVSKKMNYLGATNHLSDEVVFLTDSLNNLKELIRKEKIKLEVFVQEKDLLNQNKSVLKLSKEFIIDDLMDLTEYFRERMLDVESNLSSTNFNLSALVKKEKKIERQLKTLNNNAKNQFSNIVIQLTAMIEGEYDYELSYNVNEAGWIPYYDIRTDKFNSPVNSASI